MTFVGPWHKEWQRCLDTALYDHFSHSTATDSTEILNANNALIEATRRLRAQTLGSHKGPRTLDQFSFLRDYEGKLQEADELCFWYNKDWMEAEEAGRTFPDEENARRIREVVDIYSNVCSRLGRQIKAAGKVRDVVPLVKRKRDLVYFVYFAIHILVIIFVDAAALLEPHQRPAISNTFFKLQSEGYGDQFFAKGDIQFFNFFRLMEICLHLPISVWALRALPRDDYKIPLILLPFAIQVAVTTATCIWDYTFWTEIDYAAKWNLTTLYGPYLILSVFMMVDMFGRLKRSLNEWRAMKGFQVTA